MSTVIIRIVEVLFLIGVAGCLVTIPVAAWGYISVLFEKDEEEGQPARNPQAAD